MDKVLLTTGIMTLGGYLWLWIFHPNRTHEAVALAADMFGQALPWVIVSMLAAGLIAQFFHPQTIARLLGRESGLVGIVIGATLGLLGTGSRWAAYPLAAALLSEGAGAGAVFSFLTSWQLLSLTRLPAEVPFLGLRFTLTRAAVSFLLAVAGGLVVDHWHG